MVQSVTERVRLSPVEGRLLNHVAKSTRRSKSEVLRAGLQDQAAKVELQANRRWAFNELARMAKEIPGGPKIPWRMKH